MVNDERFGGIRVFRRGRSGASSGGDTPQPAPRDPKEDVAPRAGEEAANRDAIEAPGADGEPNQAESERLSGERSSAPRGVPGLPPELAADYIERRVIDGRKEGAIEPAAPGEPASSLTESGERDGAAPGLTWPGEEADEVEEKPLGASEEGTDPGASAGAAIEGEAPPVSIEVEEERIAMEDLLENGRWLGLVEELVKDEGSVFGELESNRDRLDPDKPREIADHVMMRLAEVLERSGVEVIWDDEAFDSKRHAPEKASGRIEPGAAIAETLSPGFAVGRRVLRRARVRVEQ